MVPPNNLRHIIQDAAARYREGEREDECILSLMKRAKGADQGPDGYRTLMVDKVNYQAHNYALRLAVGPPPPGKNRACHTCATPACVNPAHLYWGDALDNSRDALADGALPLGADAASAKLTDEQVYAILADTRPQRVIAAEYGVGPTIVWAIRNRKKWKHLPWPR